MPGPLSVNSSYDAVVIGARVAGAATALRLAHRGLRVLMIDRGRYGTDTVSTHALMRAGVLQPARRCAGGNNRMFHHAGQTATRQLTLTAEHVRKYSEISGDYNPLHYDEGVAAATPFGKLVVQGGLTTGTAARTSGHRPSRARHRIHEPELEVHRTRVHRRHDYSDGGSYIRARRQASVPVGGSHHAAGRHDRARGGSLVLSLRGPCGRFLDGVE